jgi:hypothetical protein
LKEDAFLRVLGGLESTRDHEGGETGVCVPAALMNTVDAG